MSAALASEKSALLEVAKDASGLDIATVLERVHPNLTAMIPCDGVVTFAWDPDRNRYHVIAEHGADQRRDDIMALEFSRDLPAAERFLNAGTVVINDIHRQRWLPVHLLEGFGIGALVGTPLVETFAVHHAIHRGRTEPFTPQQRRIMRGIAQVAPLALETASLFAELETVNQVKEHFVATLTHELRSPITAISGYHFLALENPSTLSTDQKDWIERAERCTLELNALITATLDLSRFQTKRVKVDWQDLSVAALVSELSREIQAPADKPGLRLIWEAAPGTGTIHTDPLKLKMVLRNLVTNAVKFTEYGQITLDAHPHDGGVELRVSDTGIGIPAAALPTLFEPFTQAHGMESRRKGGAGLGLHLVKRLVEILGGTVEVDSQVGCGSTFRIWLPRDGSQVRLRDATPS